MMPRFSVVTPSFNQGRYIADCLQSVLRQDSGTNYVEHIVIDNCSADGTAGILREQERRAAPGTLHVIIEPDEGQTAAINKGFEVCTGELVCWLNTDERLSAGALHHISNVFHSNPDVDVVFGDCRFLDSSGNDLGTRRSFAFSANMLLFYGCYIPSCATFFRRQVIEREKLDESYRVTMDYEFYVRLLKQGCTFLHTSYVVADFIWHGQNISVKERRRRRQEALRVKLQYAPLPMHLPPFLHRSAYATLVLLWKGYRFCRRVYRGIR